MADSSVTYGGDGSTVNFSVTFPYIQTTHVEVYKSGVLQATPADYTWTSATVITFNSAPQDGASIVIKRVTPGATRLVDFQNGANLTEADLDLAVNQVFYLAQETKENLTALINAEILRIGGGLGLTSTDPDDVFAGVVSNMLEDAAAVEIQARIADIDQNGEDLLEHDTLWNLIGTHNTGYTAFALDTTTVHLDDPDTGDTLATRLTALATADSDNAAAVITEQTARIAGDTAIASDLALIGAANGGGTAFIMDTSTVKLDSDGGSTMSTKVSEIDTHTGQFARTTASTLNTAVTNAEGDITNLEARYGVSLNVNGYITGFLQHNDGDSGTFDILTDKFRIVDPASGGQNPTFVFSIESGNVLAQNMYLDNLVLGSNGAIRIGKTSASSTTNGLWFGTDGSSDYDLHVGDADNSLWWDGSAGTLNITGTINMTNAVSSFTPTWSGFSTAPSGGSNSINYINFGAYVVMWCEQNILGTSNNASTLITNIPSAIQPNYGATGVCPVIDSSQKSVGAFIFIAGSLYFDLSQETGSTVDIGVGGFTTSGQKGLPAGWIITYPIA